MNLLKNNNEERNINNQNNIEDNTLIQENNINTDISINSQNNFLETTMGKAINLGLDIGLRAVLPDLIENEVIGIKDTILQEGFSEGIKKVISSAIDIGKSAIGIITGNFENISQVQTAIKNGGIIDSTSNLIDFVLDKTYKSGLLPYGVKNTIKQGKNIILNNISNKIENEFNEQMASAERLQKYTNNWKEAYKSKDFEEMTKQITKIKKELKTLIPIENTLKESRQIENLHNLIKNNGKDFNLSKEQLELANILI